MVCSRRKNKFFEPLYCLLTLLPCVLSINAISSKYMSLTNMSISHKRSADTIYDISALVTIRSLRTISVLTKPLARMGLSAIQEKTTRLETMTDFISYTVLSSEEEYQEWNQLVRFRRRYDAAYLRLIVSIWMFLFHGIPPVRTIYYGNITLLLRWKLTAPPLPCWEIAPIKEALGGSCV